MTKFGLLLFLATVLAGNSMANAQFSGPFAPTNWTLENFGDSDGAVDWSGAPDQLILVGGDSGSFTFGSTDIYITIRHAGVIQYRWDYSSNDEPNFDFAFELSGSAGGRTLLSSNNGESGVQVVEVVPGDTFGFAIESVDNQGSPGVLAITEFAFFPENDSIGDAISLSLPFETTGTNVGATVQANEQDLQITGSTVWWQFQASATGSVTIHTFDSDFDTVLHVYAGDLVAENDDFNGAQSQVTFEVTEGVLYHVRVGGYAFNGGPAAEGNISLTGFFNPPANDLFENLLDIAFPFDTTGTNVRATVQANEQDLDETGSTVWWAFQAPLTDRVTISTAGSDFDTVLHIYTDLGNGFGNFTLVDQNDQANGTDQSRVTFNVTPGQFYAVRVGGFKGGSGPAAEGNIVLKGVAFVLGDANGDGFFDFGDIEPFVLAITDPDSFAELFPNVDPNLNLDFDGDGSLSFGDIEGFVDGLLG